ncbi:MAG: dihydrofolate reductase family protein [Dyadobacter sp.]|uniref:dihydrofolate reductase family protein n=1 Tax=Dyadobacter sp. TaxID=1914288 RepID=UPI0032679E6C
MSKKVILYIAASLDGYIATNDDDLGFLSIVEQPGQDYGYGKFIETIDTVIIGRKTYDKVLSMGFDYPHADKKSYIVTRSAKPDIGNIQFFTGDLKELVTDLKQQEGKDIFVDGGAEVVNLLMQHDLFDDFIVSLIPTFLGDGIRLFKGGRPAQNLEFISSESFESGLVQLHYKRKIA